ncbi:MAG: PilN domain-containing protein [Patescibacteria group bacterium]|jgi:Tfp pilus assembly protein PilN
MININLLPPELKYQRIVAKRNASLMTVCIVIIFIAIIIGVISKSLQSTVETYLSSTKNNIQKNSESLDRYQDLQNLAVFINDRWQTTQGIEKKHVYWSQVLQELSNSAPSDVQFESLVATTEKTPNFVLQGNTTTEREIIKFKEKLEATSFFKNVSFKSSSLSPDETTPDTKVNKLKFTLEFDLEQNKAEGSVSGIKNNQKKSQ